MRYLALVRFWARHILARGGVDRIVVVRVELGDDGFKSHAVVVGAVHTMADGPSLMESSKRIGRGPGSALRVYTIRHGSRSRRLVTNFRPCIGVLGRGLCQCQKGLY